MVCMACISMIVLALATPSLIVHALERLWYQARHAWSSHLAFLLVWFCFLCVLFVRVPFCFVVASNLVSLYDPFLFTLRS